MNRCETNWKETEQNGTKQGGRTEGRSVDREQTGGRNGGRTEEIDKQKDRPMEGRTI